MSESKKSLLEAIKETRPLGAGSKCTVTTILAKLDKDDRDGLVEAIADPGIQGTTISRVLKDRGFRLEPKSIQRHRRGECLCGEDQ